MSNRHWRYHFLGYDEGEGYNDGTSVSRDLILESDREYEPDYSEDDEEMVVVEHAEGNSQIRLDEANSAAGLSEYNVFRKNGLYGVCDHRNRVIIPPIYEEMHPCHNGYIPFRQDGKWGILLTNGTVKVKPKYYWISPFVDGIAEIRNTEFTPKYHINSKLQRIDEHGSRETNSRL